MFMPFFTMKSRKLAFLGASATLALLSACSGFYYDKSAISDQADLNNPPRLYRATGNQNQLEWDRPAAFGRVPAHLQSRGNVVCSILGKDITAIGYNPNALDQNGKAIPGGGYFCGRI